MFRIHTLRQLTSVLILSVILLAACGPAPTPQVIVQTQVVSQVVTATPEPESTAAPKPSGKITVWCWKAAQDTIVNPGVVADFNAEYPDIQVEFVTYNPSDIYQKLPLALTAGTGAPDVSCVEDSHLAQFVDLGGLTDLSDRVQPYVDEVNSYKWIAGQKDGKYYSVPWDSGPVVTYYRRDVFKAAELPDDPDSVSAAVATWDKYLETCKTIKEKTGNNCFPNNKANNDGRLYEMMLWQQGLGYYADNGDITVDSPENIASLQKLGEFWEGDLVSDQQSWTDNWYADFSSLDKPVATFVEAAWMGVFYKTWIAPGTAGKWGVALMPAMKEGQARAANDGGSGFVIPDQGQNKEAAWAFAEFVSLHKNSQNKMFAYGDFFPALETAYDDPLYIEPDSFFGGQVTRKVYVDVVKEIPTAHIYGPRYADMNKFVSTAIQKFATGEMSAEDALKEAADGIRSNQ